MIRVAIVILNWNGKQFLEEFLPSVIKYSNIEGAKVIIADNASSDNSVGFIRENAPSVEIIRLDKNYGFAEGYNRALDQIESEYFVLLNSDVKVTEGWLNPLLGMMDSDSLVGACMPKIKSYSQPDFFEYAGAAGGFIDKYGYTFCQGRIFDSIENDFGQYDASREIFWASGACLMVRASLFKITGGLDSRFFAHMEEIDLCWRFKNRGYKIMYVSTSIVFHVGGGTLPRSNPQKTYLNFRNNLYLLSKNLPHEKLVNILIIRFLMDLLSELRFLFRGAFRDFFAIIQAHFTFFMNRKYCTVFRKNEQQFMTSHTHKQIYPGSIVYDYFIRKKYTFKSLKWIIKENQ
jgi:GT2 family glycosyltransferase